MLNRNSLPGINEKATEAEMSEVLQDLMENGPIDLREQSARNGAPDSKSIA